MPIVFQRTGKKLKEKVDFLLLGKIHFFPYSLSREKTDLSEWLSSETFVEIENPIWIIEKGENTIKAWNFQYFFQYNEYFRFEATILSKSDKFVYARVVKLVLTRRFSQASFWLRYSSSRHLFRVVSKRKSVSNFWRSFCVS